VLCCAVLCCAVLCCAVLCCAALRCAALRWGRDIRVLMLYHGTLFTSNLCRLCDHETVSLPVACRIVQGTAHDAVSGCGCQPSVCGGVQCQPACQGAFAWVSAPDDTHPIAIKPTKQVTCNLRPATLPPACQQVLQVGWIKTHIHAHPHAHPHAHTHTHTHTHTHARAALRVSRCCRKGGP
jgi:hypothetical protein